MTRAAWQIGGWCALMVGSVPILVMVPGGIVLVMLVAGGACAVVLARDAGGDRT